jgi:hypothetical protein
MYLVINDASAAHAVRVVAALRLIAFLACAATAAARIKAQEGRGHEGTTLSVRSAEIMRASTARGDPRMGYLADPAQAGRGPRGYPGPGP